MPILHFTFYRLFHITLSPNPGIVFLHRPLHHPRQAVPAECRHVTGPAGTRSRIHCPTWWTPHPPGGRADNHTYLHDLYYVIHSDLPLYLQGRISATYSIMLNKNKCCCCLRNWYFFHILVIYNALKLYVILVNARLWLPLLQRLNSDIMSYLQMKHSIGRVTW